MNRGSRGSSRWTLAGPRASTILLGCAIAIGCGVGGSPSPETTSPPPGPATGTATEGPPATTDCIEPACQNIPLPPSAHAIRLTHPQWVNTVRDLLVLGAADTLTIGALAANFPPDPAPPAGQFGRDSGSLVVTNSLWHEYQGAAESAAALVMTTPGQLDKILPAAAATGDTATRVNAFLQAFLPRAYRRPVLPIEITTLATLADNVAASDVTSDPFLLRVQWILAAVLQSPQFLYRVEAGDGPVVDGRSRLGPYELASKLSYALFGTMPDDKLLGYAASGKLWSSQGVADVVAEMMADSRMTTTLIDFHDQLFAIGAYASVVRQTSLFPKYYPRFGKDAQDDVRRTIQDLVIAHPGGVSELYGSKAAYMNATLADLYGIDPTTVPGLVASPDAFVKVDMPSPRLGILSHLGWLAMEGKPKDPATIQRGVYVARHVLCLSLGSPPAAAAGKDPSQINAPTNRARVAGITAGCGDGCHGGPGGMINPLGFAFEEFDSLGAFRTLDGTDPIDSTGALDQLGSFTDAASMMSKAAANPRTHACYAAHWNAFLNGITDVQVKPRWLSPIIASSMKGASVRDIVAAVVQTDAFLTVSR